MIFVSLLSIGFIMTVAYLLSDQNVKYMTLKESTAYFLSWMYDNIGLEQLSAALLTISHRHPVSIACTAAYLYIMQFFFKNVVHRLFVSVVIEGRPQITISLQKVTRDQ
jgi:hypothetical protein